MIEPTNKLPDGFDIEAAINECLDLEAAGRPDELRVLMLKARAIDPEFDAKLLKTRAAVGQLRGMPEAPNVAPQVLTEVNYLRPFLSPRRRRQVSATRVAVAAAAVLTLTFMGVMHRMYPQATSSRSEPTPVTGVVEASRADATTSVRSLVSAVDELRHGVSKPVTASSGRHGRSRIWPGNESALAISDTSRYDSDMLSDVADARASRHTDGLLEQPRRTDTALVLADVAWPGPTLLGMGSSGLLEQRSNRLIPNVDPGAALLDFHEGGLLPPFHTDAPAKQPDKLDIDSSKPSNPK